MDSVLEPLGATADVGSHEVRYGQEWVAGYVDNLGRSNVGPGDIKAVSAIAWSFSNLWIGRKSGTDARVWRIARLKSGQFAKNAKSDQTRVEIILHPSEVNVSHSSMLKARRQHQKTRKLLDAAVKQAKRQAKLAVAGPVVKKEKVKKEKVKVEKVKTEKVKKVKLTKQELGMRDAKKGAAGVGKKGSS